MAVPRFLYPNYVRAASTAVSVSSELSSHPRHWLQDPLRSKPWRSKTGWTIVAGFNDEITFRTDDGFRIGHIVPGTYATGAAMATAVATAMTNAGYNPRATLACSGWWRGDSVVVVAGRASQATDLSSNGTRHASQSTAADRPLWLQAAVDNRPAFYFDGTSTTMRLSTAAPLSTFLGANGIGTISIVFRLDSDASALDGIINATGPGGERFGLLWVGGNNFQGEAYDSTQRFAIDASVVAGAGNWHHVIVRYDQTNLSTWVDDMDDAAATSIAMTGAQAAAVLTAVLNIGNHPSAVFKGYIAEVIIFPTALDQTTRRGITMYLKGRYPSMALNDTTTAVSFGATTASYSTSAKAFTLAGGSTVFQLLCATGVPAEDRIASCFLDLGFTLTDKTGALNYTAVNQSYQSRHFLKAELAAAASITAGAVLDHNAGAGGTFTLEGNSIDLFLVPPVSQALSGDATLRIAFFNATSQRIWRLVINDVSNIAGYAEVGKWSVSPYVQATYCHSQDFSKTLEELSPIGYGTHGSHFADERPQRWVWTLTWQDMPDADRTLFETLVQTLKAGQTFFVAWDPVSTPTDTFYVFRRDPVSWSMTAPTPLWNIPVSLAEALD